MNGVQVGVLMLVVIVIGVFGILAVASIKGEVSQQCMSGQYVYNETSKGDFGCSLVTYSAVTYSALAQLPFNVSKGLVGYWPMNEGAGATCALCTANAVTYDYSGSGNAMTLFNAPTWVQGRFGSGLSFVSANTQYGTSSENPSGNGFTVSFWVKATSLTNNPDALGDDIPVNSKNGFRINLPSDGGVVITMGNGATFVGTPDVAGRIAAGAWYQITITYDGTTIRTYVNAAAKDTATLTGPMTAGVTGINIARRTDGGQLLNGILDDVRIYNYPLSAVQVSQLYNWVPST